MEEKIINLLLEVLPKDIDKNMISIDEPLTSYGINSVLFIKFVLSIEEEFDIEFSEDLLSMDRFENIKSIISYIEEIKESTKIQ